MKKFIGLFRQTNERLYHWTGVSHLGESHAGQIRSHNKQSAKIKLKKQALVIKTLKRSRYKTKRLTQRDVTAMMAQLTALMNADLSLVQALSILISSQTNSKMVTLLTKIQLDMAAGLQFSEALQRHPQWFDQLVYALLALGEQAGTVIPMMDKISAHFTAKAILKQQLQTILTYPITVLAIASTVTLYLLLTVVPQFQSLFQNMHANLPWATRAMLSLASALKAYGVICLISMFCSLIGLRYAYKKYSTFTLWFDTWILAIPGIGSLYQHIYLARSFHALAITHQAGLPIVDALQWVAYATKNLCFSQALLAIRTALIHGDSMRSALCSTDLFPELVTQMLSLGEESGTLQELLFDLAHYYTHSIEHAVQRFSRLIEPTLMTLLGIIVGGLVLAMYLPIISLGTLI